MPEKKTNSTEELSAPKREKTSPCGNLSAHPGTNSDSTVLPDMIREENVDDCFGSAVAINGQLSSGNRQNKCKCSIPRHPCASQNVETIQCKTVTPKEAMAVSCLSSEKEDKQIAVDLERVELMVNSLEENQQSLSKNQCHCPHSQEKWKTHQFEMCSKPDECANQPTQTSHNPKQIAKEGNEILEESCENSCLSRDYSLGLYSYQQCSPHSSSSSEEDPESCIRFDAMDDSSGTSDDAEDTRTDVSSDQTSFQSNTPSPVVAFQRRSTPSFRFLATSTPHRLPVYYPQFKSPSPRRTPHDLSPCDYNKIKCLAASMPVFPELGLTYSRPVGKKGRPNSFSPGYTPVKVILSSPQTPTASQILETHSQRLTSTPDNKNLTPVKSRCAFESPQADIKPLTHSGPWVSPKTWVSPTPPRTQNLFKVPNDPANFDLSPNLIRDFAEREFALATLPLSQIGPTGKRYSCGVIPDSHKKLSEPLGRSSSRRRLDKLFNTPPSGDTREDYTTSVRLKERRNHFKSETEEAVYHLIQKYLQSPPCSSTCDYDEYLHDSPERSR